MPELKQDFVVAKPRPQVWAIFQDIETVAACLPGASLTEPPAGNEVKGQMTVRLGPVKANFAGQAQIETDGENYVGTISGSGIDKSQGSRAKGAVRYALEEADGGTATRVLVSVDYTLSGALAQFSRGGVVEAVAAKLTQDFANNLEAELAGGADGSGGSAPAQGDGGADGAAKSDAERQRRTAGRSNNELSAFALLGAIIKSWFRRLFGRG